ncbi:hypothetical protein SAMN05443667_1203 [Flavobacterium gillisiae]|uniref:Uncharacterized protein n=1 Tax=Flavobacterium gillisiae TaxID=150146 RepID=A0A1H4GDX3_9FLAO|nr:hypothetical protein SAMN05443667_1203 [Flavobacterium gillisiae]
MTIEINKTLVMDIVKQIIGQQINLYVGFNLGTY